MEVRLENKSLPLPESQKQISLEHNMSWEEPITFTPPLRRKEYEARVSAF